MARRAKRYRVGDPVQRAAQQRKRYHDGEMRRASRKGIVPDWVQARIDASIGVQHIGKPSRVPPVSGLTGAQKGENRRIRASRVPHARRGKPGRAAPSFDVEPA